MSSIDQTTLAAFHAELEKMAFSPRISSAIGSAGALGGVGALAGGLAGAANSGYKAYQQSREQGEGVGSSLLHGVGGVLNPSAIGRGAMAGATLGAVGGAGLGSLSPAHAEALRKKLTNSSAFARFGQRQAHGLTGWKPSGGLEELRMGASDLKPAIEAAKKEVAMAAPQATGVRGFFAKNPQKNLERLEASQAALQKAEDMGLTSIPGYVKSFLNKPGETLSTGLKAQWHGTNPAEKALMLGLPAYSVAQEALSDEDPTGQGRSKAERVAGGVANTLAGAVLGPLPAFTNMKLTEGATTLGESAGRILGPRQRPPGVVMSSLPQDLTADSGQAVPGERVVSERAAGSMGEGSPS